LQLLLNSNIINLNTNNYNPNFRDLNFTVDLPTKKRGVFSIWGLMGNDETYQTTLTEKNIDKGSLNVFGLNHKISFRKVFFKNVLSISYQSQENLKQNITAGVNGLVTRQLIYKYPSLRFSSALTYKFNNRLTIESGIVLSDLSYNLKDNRLNSKNVLFNYLNDDGSTNFFQVYAQLLAKLSSKIKTTIGVHQYKFLLNNANAFEPRWALNIENKWGGVFSTGINIHLKHPDN
jgi:hypothetical protein